MPTAQPLEPEELPVEEAEGAQEITVDGDSDPESIQYIQEMLSATGLLSEDDVNGVYDEATADAVRRFGLTPRVALVSHSSFGGSDSSHSSPSMRART